MDCVLSLVVGLVVGREGDHLKTGILLPQCWDDNNVAGVPLLGVLTVLASKNPKSQPNSRK